MLLFYLRLALKLPLMLSSSWIIAGSSSIICSILPLRFKVRCSSIYCKASGKKSLSKVFMMLNKKALGTIQVLVASQSGK